MNVFLRRLFSDSSISIASSILAAAAIFYTFRLGFQHVGGNQLGAWALLTGLTAFARFAETGANLSVARQVVLDSSPAERPAAGPALAAGLSLATLPATVLSGVVVTIAVLMLNREHKIASDFNELMCLSIGVVLFAALNSTSGILSGVLDGTRQISRRAATGVVSSVVLIGLSSVLIPRYGLYGFVISNLGYNFVQGLFYFIAIRSSAKLSLSRLEYLRACRQCGAFMGRAMILGVARAGFEPLTKLLINISAGLTAVAVFDLANRVSVQVRQIASSPMQIIAIETARDEAHLTETQWTRVFHWIERAFIIATVFALMQVIGAPLLSLFSIGHIDAAFLLVNLMLAIAMVFNSVGVTAYNVTMSSGQVKILIAIHFVMLAINLVVGLLLNPFWNLAGAFSWSLALGIGGPLTLVVFMRMHGQSFSPLRRLAFLIPLALTALVAASFFAPPLTHGALAIIKAMLGAATPA